MSKEAKYYFTSPISEQGISARRQPQVIKWDQDYSIDVDENVDYRQNISLLINKLKQRDTPKPVSSRFDKVRPVIKEIFLSHYSLALKFIQETSFDEGEFYLYNRSKDWWQIGYFSNDEKQGKHRNRLPRFNRRIVAHTILFTWS